MDCFHFLKARIGIFLLERNFPLAPDLLNRGASGLSAHLKQSHTFHVTPEGTLQCPRPSYHHKMALQTKKPSQLCRCLGSLPEPGVQARRSRGFTCALSSAGSQPPTLAFSPLNAEAVQAHGVRNEAPRPSPRRPASRNLIKAPCSFDS